MYRRPTLFSKWKAARFAPQGLVRVSPRGLRAGHGRRVGPPGTWEVSDSPLWIKRYGRRLRRGPGRRYYVQCRAERTKHERNGTLSLQRVRTGSEKSEFSHSTDEIGERIPSGAGGGKGKTGSRCSRRDRWQEHRVHKPSQHNNLSLHSEPNGSSPGG